MNLRVIVIGFLFLFFACKAKDSNEYISPSLEMESYLSAYPKDSQHCYVVYYFSGDCSICYGNILTMSKELKTTPIFCISSSKDTLLTNLYIQKIGFLGPVLCDSLQTFYKANSEVLKNNKIILVDQNYKVLAKSEFVFDEKTSDRFKKIVNDFNKYGL